MDQIQGDMSRQALVSLLTAYALEPCGDEGFPKAEVTGGGVSLLEVQTQTLESRRAAQLHVCGELLDVFGAALPKPETLVISESTASLLIQFFLNTRMMNPCLGFERTPAPCGFRTQRPWHDASTVCRAGRIGGFNFYWAWLSGRLAGMSAAKSCNEAEMLP